MDLFDKKGGLQDTVGAHPTTSIPDELSWNNMGAGILAGVEKRKKNRRLLIWWWGVGLSLLGLSSILFFSQIQNKSIAALPIPQNGEAFIETTENINQLTKNKGVNLQNSKEIKIEDAKEKVKKIASQKIITKDEKEKTLIYQIAQKNPFTKLLESNNAILKIDDSINNKKVSQSIDSQYVRSSFESLLNLPVIISLLDVDNIDETIPFPTIPLKKGDWHIAISGGANWWQYGAKGAEVEAKSTTLSGWQADIRITKEITNKLSIKTGLGVQQLRFRSNYIGTKEILVFQPNTIDTIKTSSLTGQQTFTYRDSVPGIQTRNFQHYNRHTTLQIPLLLSYQIRKQRWTVAFQTGFALKLLPKTSGRLAMSGGVIIDLEDAELYTKNIRWSHLLETEIGYRATPSLTIFARYGLENNLTNWIDGDLPYQQKPKIMALNLGVSCVLH